jgi:hypothetical protein
MKKALILALLVVSVASALGRQSTFEYRYRASEIARSLASPLFWHLGDELLARELAHWTSSAPQLTEESEWWRDSLVSVLFQVFLQHAFEGFPSPQHKNDCSTVSIPQYLVRRIVELEFTPIREDLANQRQDNYTKERSICDS